MALYTLNGYELPLASVRQRGDGLKTIERTVTGQLFTDVIARKLSWDVEFVAKANADLVFWRQLLSGLGHKFSFDLNTFSSKGLVSNTPANGSIGGTSPSPKFGLGRLGVSPAMTYTFSGYFAWTVSVWVWTGSVWQLRQQTSAGDKWQAGVKGSYAWDYALSGGVLTLPTSTFYDDLVVLPYVLPDARIEAWPTGFAWPALPWLRLSGDALGGEVYTVALADDEPDLEQIAMGGVPHARLSCLLREV